MTTENTQIAMTEEQSIEISQQHTNAVVEFTPKDGDKVKVESSFFITEHEKSGRLHFVSQKALREEFGLKNADAKRLHGLCRQKFGTTWSAMKKAEWEVTESFIEAESEWKMNASGTVETQTIKVARFVDKPVAEKAKAISEMSVEEIMSALGEKSGEVFKAMAAKAAKSQAAEA